MDTIISNYTENATVVISTHLIADIEKVLDEVVFISAGQIALQPVWTIFERVRVNLWTPCSGRYSDARKIDEIRV